MITLHFHPNWPHKGETVIDSMATDGFYRSQFTTGISNGGLTAFQGACSDRRQRSIQPDGAMSRGGRGDS
ncbi:DUF3626 domain-containing protein [Kribbella solani]|uniref:DUF3626 domain-containing protein n=1 Tax=Kribbella solani TaxID=236067 RepID=UPI00192D524D